MPTHHHVEMVGTTPTVFVGAEWPLDEPPETLRLYDQTYLRDAPTKDATLARGHLLMHGSTVPWPPRSQDGRPVQIGDVVVGPDTWVGLEIRRFTVGTIRLQENGDDLRWVLCCYDKEDRYYEAFADSCLIVASREVAPWR